MKIFLLLLSMGLASACALETHHVQDDSVIQEATVIKSASSSSMKGVVSND
jgi:hypothetical protein